MWLLPVIRTQFTTGSWIWHRSSFRSWSAGKQKGILNTLCVRQGTGQWRQVFEGIQPEGFERCQWCRTKWACLAFCSPYFSYQIPLYKAGKGPLRAHTLI